MKNYGEKIVWGLCLCAPFLFLIIARCFRFNGLYGQDGHEYLHLANSIQEYFKTGQFSQRSSFPLAYPFLGWLISRTGIDAALSLQLISAISFLISIIYLKRLLQYFYPEAKPAPLFIALFFILSPYVIRFSILVMSDMMAMSLLLICFLHTMRYSEKWKTGDLIVVACSAMLAFETRYATALPVIILNFYLLFSFIKRKKLPSAFHLILVLFLNIGISVCAYILQGEVFGWKYENGAFHFAYSFTNINWSVTHFFQDHFENADGTQQYPYWNILQVWNNVLHPAFLFCGIILLLFTRKADFAKSQNRLVASTIIVYALFIAGLPYQNNRYLLLTFPIVLLFLFPAFTRIVYHVGVIFPRRRFKVAIVLLIFAVQLILFFLSFQSIYELNSTERSIASTLKNFPNQTIYTASMNGALESYDVKNKMIDLMQLKISTIDSNSLLLMNESYFQQHWANQNPMINFNWILQHAQLISLQQFPQGWTLYAIKP